MIKPPETGGGSLDALMRQNKICLHHFGVVLIYRRASVRVVPECTLKI